MDSKEGIDEIERKPVKFKPVKFKPAKLNLPEPSKSLEDARCLKRKLALITTGIRTMNQVINRRSGSTPVGPAIDSDTNLLIFLESLRMTVNTGLMFLQTAIDIETEDYDEDSNIRRFIEAHVPTEGYHLMPQDIICSAVTDNQVALNELSSNFNMLLDKFERRLLELQTEEPSPDL